MAIITSITESRKNKKRADIFLDGEFCCCVEKFSVLSFSLKEGGEIDGERLLGLISDSERNAAFDWAVKYISLRPRTRAEIIAYLDKKGYAGDISKTAADKLCEYGYVDDRKFCLLYVKEYSKKFGKRKISYDLSRLGVEPQIIAECIDSTDKDEDECADNVARKYAERKKSVEFKKLFAFLQSRGFGNETAYRAAKKYSAQTVSGE